MSKGYHVARLWRGLGYLLCNVIEPGRVQCYFFFQAEDGIRDGRVTGVQTCALPISLALIEHGCDPPQVHPQVVRIEEAVAAEGGERLHVVLRCLRRLPQHESAVRAAREDRKSVV